MRRLRRRRGRISSSISCAAADISFCGKFSRTWVVGLTTVLAVVHVAAKMTPSSLLFVGGGALRPHRLATRLRSAIKTQDKSCASSVATNNVMQFLSGKNNTDFMTSLPLLKTARSLLGSREDVVKKELKGVFDYFMVLEARLQQIESRMADSEKRDRLLSKRLATALKTEIGLQESLVNVRSECVTLQGQLVTTQSLEAELKQRVANVVQMEHDLKFKVFKDPGLIKELHTVRDERMMLVQELRTTKTANKNLALSLRDALDKEVDMKKDLYAKVKQMSLYRSELGNVLESEKNLELQVETVNAHVVSLQDDIFATDLRNEINMDDLERLETELIASEELQVETEAKLILERDSVIELSLNLEEQRLRAVISAEVGNAVDDDDEEEDHEEEVVLVLRKSGLDTARGTGLDVARALRARMVQFATVLMSSNYPQKLAR